jgi:hypothetical protein
MTRNLFLALGLYSALFALPSYADTRADLIAQIQAGGKHDFGDERHSVQVEGCTLTTERWQNHPEHGWVLWTSLSFAMVDAALSEDKRTPGQYFFHIEMNDDPAQDMMIVTFKMREGTTARHEKSVLRKSRKETRPSPRNDGTTHFYEDQTNFFFMFRGPGTLDKGQAFSTAYRQYKQDYCTFTG